MKGILRFLPRPAEGPGRYDPEDDGPSRGRGRGRVSQGPRRRTEVEDETAYLFRSHRRSRRAVARLARVQLRFGRTPCRCPGPRATPGFARIAEGGRRRGRRRGLPGHTLGGAKCDRPGRTHAETRRPVDQLPGWVQRSQRRLLPRPQARAGRGGPEGRPDRPGQGGLLAISGSPRGRRRLRQGAWRTRTRRPRWTGRRPRWTGRRRVRAVRHQQGRQAEPRRGTRIPPRPVRRDRYE